MNGASGRPTLMTLLAGLCVALCALFVGCQPSTETENHTQESALQTDAYQLKIASLKGPTSIGLAPLMQEPDALYSFSIAGTADEIIPKLVQGDIDIALIPANLAATLYQKTEGRVSAIDINTLGVLYALSEDDSITSVTDLVGKTIYMTGKGSVPEYTVDYVLSAHGLNPDEVTVEFKSEPSEVLALLVEHPHAVGILPQPYATVAQIEVPALNPVLDLTEQWDLVSDEKQGGLVTGVTIVRDEVLAQHPDAVRRFLENHARSATKVNDNPEMTASLAVELGIGDDANILTQAIPACRVVCITGSEMKATLSGYLGVLYDQNPDTIGSAMPDDSFYYTG